MSNEDIAETRRQLRETAQETIDLAQHDAERLAAIPSLERNTPQHLQSYQDLSHDRQMAMFLEMAAVNAGLDLLIDLTQQQVEMLGRMMPV